MKEKVLDLHDLTAFPAFGKSGGGEKSAGKPAAASKVAPRLAKASKAFYRAIKAGEAAGMRASHGSPAERRRNIKSELRPPRFTSYTLPDKSGCNGTSEFHETGDPNRTRRRLVHDEPRC